MSENKNPYYLYLNRERESVGISFVKNNVISSSLRPSISSVQNSFKNLLTILGRSICMDPFNNKPEKKTEILSIDYKYVLREQRNKIGITLLIKDLLSLAVPRFLNPCKICRKKPSRIVQKDFNYHQLDFEFQFGRAFELGS